MGRLVPYFSYIEHSTLFVNDTNIFSLLLFFAYMKKYFLFFSWICYKRESFLKLNLFFTFYFFVLDKWAKLKLNLPVWSGSKSRLKESVKHTNIHTGEPNISMLKKDRWYWFLLEIFSALAPMELLYDI